MDTFDTIKEKLEDYFEVTISKDTTFKSLEMDSLDMIEVQMLVEEPFDIIVPDDAMMQLQTVGDLVQLVESIINS